MSKNNYRKVRKEAKNLYRQFKEIVCPALGNEPVHFNNIGFNHILRKKKSIRPISDQIRRFKLFPYIKEILMSGKLKDYRKIGTAQFFTISHVINNKKLQVTIIQIGNGQKNFLSIAITN